MLQDPELNKFYSILREYWAEAEGSGQPIQDDGYSGDRGPEGGAPEGEAPEGESPDGEEPEGEEASSSRSLEGDGATTGSRVEGEDPGIQFM